MTDHSPLPIAAGVRRLAAILSSAGFIVFDTDDGEDDQDARPRIPKGFLLMRIAPDSLVNESERLLKLLERLGLRALSVDEIDEATGPSILTLYDPVSKQATLELADVHDSILPQQN